MHILPFKYSDGQWLTTVIEQIISIFLIKCYIQQISTVANDVLLK